MTRPAPRPTPPGRPRRCRRGFTLVEVLVAVVLIGILATLLIVGISKLLVNSKRQQTHVILEQCQAMYADWQVLARQRFSASTMPPPGDVTQQDRFGPAVWFTRDLMSHLRQTPANQAALGKMSAASTMSFPASQGLPFAVGFSANVWDGTKAYTPFQGSDYGRVYRIPDPVNFPTTWVYYQSIQYVPAPASGTNPPPESDPTRWFLAYPVEIGSGGAASPDSVNVPVPLDAWGNPIIFVSGGTLGSVNSPDGRPFFASAGPDGNFSATDDNLYSFEK